MSTRAALLLSTGAEAIALLCALPGCGNHAPQLAGAAGNAGEGGGSGNGATERRICDGSTSVRLAFTYAAGTGTKQAFTSVLDDLGAQFLYVDGGCRYWVQEPSLTADGRDEYYAWRPYRTGLLSAQQERALHSAVDYDDLGSESFVSACGGQPASDQRFAQLWDGQRVRTCQGMLEAASEWPMRKELYDEGEDFAGPMRIQVGIDAVSDKATVYSWPLAESPAAFSVDYGSKQSFRIDDAADLAVLRALRDKVFSEAAGNPIGFSGVIVAEPDGYVRQVADETYVMSLRDDPPFTNENGTWAPP